MRDLAVDLSHLSINTATVRKQLELPGIIEQCVRRGIRLVCPWRDQVHAAGLDRVGKHLRDARVSLSGYCRGGFFPASDPAGLTAALDDNRKAVDEAKSLGAPCIVMVVGSLPGALTGAPTSHSLALARQQVLDGLAATLAYAQTVGMPLAIEPLHPMQAAERACVNTLEQALDMCDALDPDAEGKVGVVVDAYHVWWDPKLESQIRRAGAKRLLAYHVCDWLVPTRDLVNDRGMMGDGVIELKKLRGFVEGSGYRGPVEVEIFSEKWWGVPAVEVLDQCVSRYRTVA
jgi:sugar phosphate isomerase/epimerase